MTAAHIHLLLNHIPVLAIFFGTIILAYGIFRKSGVARAAAMWSFLVVAVFAGATYLTGEPAEEIVEDYAHVSEPMIHEHEEAAELALIGSGILGVLALAGLVLYRSKPMPTALPVVVLLVALVVSGLLAYAANLGGQISHPEIRSATAAAGDVSPRARDRDDD